MSSSPPRDTDTAASPRAPKRTAALPGGCAAVLAVIAMIVVLVLVVPGWYDVTLPRLVAYGLACSCVMCCVGAAIRHRMVKTSRILAAGASAHVMAMAWFVARQELHPPASLVPGGVLLAVLLLAIAAVPWLIEVRPKLDKSLPLAFARSMRHRWPYVVFVTVPLCLLLITFFRTEQWIVGTVSVGSRSGLPVRTQFGRFRHIRRQPTFSLDMRPINLGVMSFYLHDTRELPMVTDSPKVCRYFKRYENRERKAFVEECEIKQWDGTRFVFAATILDAGPDHAVGTDDDTRIGVSSPDGLHVRTEVVNTVKLGLAGASSY